MRKQFNQHFKKLPEIKNLLNFKKKYLGSWVLVSANAKVIIYFMSLGGNVRCRKEFMMSSGNSLESKCDYHIYWAKSILVGYHSLSQFCIFFSLTLVCITEKSFENRKYKHQL